MINEKICLPGLDILFHVKLVESFCVEHFTSTDLIVAGGRMPKMDWLQNMAENKRIYCADKGAKYCFEANIVPKSIFGDCDSTSKAIYNALAAKGTDIYIYPPAKDDTDLQLLLKNINSKNIVVTGVWGGRFDHLFSNVYSLLHYKQSNRAKVVLADDKEILILLVSEETVTLNFSSTKNIEAVSLLSLTTKCNVDFNGVAWELQDAELQQLVPYSISNVLKDDSNSCICTCHNGAVGLYITFN